MSMQWVDESLQVRGADWGWYIDYRNPETRHAGHWTGPHSVFARAPGPAEALFDSIDEARLWIEQRVSQRMTERNIT